MSAPKIAFRLHGSYEIGRGGPRLSGEGFLESTAEGGWRLQLGGRKERTDLPLVFSPVGSAEASFELSDVTIGIGFHWERKEKQHFPGTLSIMESDGRLLAINILLLEDYLKSVISSEMSATSSEELLKAHAVVSRSWLMAQHEKARRLKGQGRSPGIKEDEGERIRWYDREDHTHFHVCADDHCQRYQGLSRASTPAVRKAVDATAGMVLTHEGGICDARYSKCCGGITELFENVWEAVRHPYLTKVTDNHRPPPGFDTVLDTEEKAGAWITNSPEAFCNTADPEVLSQILNDYDRETVDFFRWQVEYSQEEIRELLKSRVSVDVGEVLELIPVSRGVSGRLIRLGIRGSRGEVIIGKELEIRKAFSSSHLYSAAFVARPADIHQGVPQKYLFSGAGWGHGVGLCQIGAAVMGSRGYSYTDILAHYFRGAAVEKIY